MAKQPTFTRVAKNIPEDVLNYYRKRANYVDLKLKDSGKEYTPQERMKFLAIEVFKTSSQDSVRASLVQGLSKKEEEYKQNPTDELKAEIELEKEMLKVFDESIQKLKDQETLKKEEEAAKLYKKAQQKEAYLINGVKDFTANLEILKNSLIKGKEDKVSVILGVLESLLNNYVKTKTEFTTAVWQYNKFTGKEYPNKAPELKFSNEEIEDLLEKTIELKDSAEVERTKEKCNKLMDLYKKLLVNPAEFKEMVKRVTQRLEEKKKAAELKSKENINARMLEIEKEYLKKYQEKMSTFQDTQDLFMEMHGKICDVFDEHPELTQEERNQYESLAYDTLKDDISKIYSEDLKEVIGILTEIDKNITQLASLEYGTEVFEETYSKIRTDIKLLIASDAAKKVNANVVFDEENLLLHVIFKSDLVKDYTRAIVKSEVLNQIKGVKKGAEKGTSGTAGESGAAEQVTEPITEPVTEPITEPVTEPITEPVTEPVTEPKKDDARNVAITHYIDLLTELNAQYEAINECNRNLSALALADLSTIDQTKVDQIAEAERIAQSHDLNIMRTKLDLSNARAELRTKHNCYVTSIKEVAEFKTSKISFGNNYEEFMSQYNRLIVKAELEIIKLDKEMNDTNTPDERKAQINSRIVVLRKYIETVNSFIDRRIVTECAEKGLDIVSLLKARNEERNKLRDELQKELTNPVTEPERELETPEQVKERLTKELEVSLNDVYAKWLSAIKNDEVINEEAYRNEIDKIIASSELVEKDQVAAKLNEKFESEKETVLISKLETDLVNVKQEIDALPITDEFENQVLALYDKLRVKYERVFERFGMKYSLAENNVQILINAEPPMVPGKKLEPEMISAQKAQEYKEFLEKKNYVDITEEQILLTARTILGSMNNKSVEKVIEGLAIFRGYTREQVLKIMSVLEERGVIKLTADGKFEEIISSYEEYIQKFHNANIVISPKIPTNEPKLIPEVKVSKPNALNLRTDKPAIISRLTNKILTVDELGLRIIKNGFKIKYSESLRQELKALNAKLSLVKKGDGLQRRTSINFDENAEEQDLAFKNISEDFDAKDYKIEVRSRQTDENGELTNRSDLVYDLEMSEELLKNLPEEPGRRL